MKRFVFPLLCSLSLLASSGAQGLGETTITPSNGNDPRTVAPTVAEDDDTLSGTVRSEISAAGDDDTVEANNDTVGVEVQNSQGLQPFGISVIEGASADYRMKLTSQPNGGNVTLTLSVSSGSDVSFSPTLLTFTPSNWNALQTVTASADEDDDRILNESTLTITASGADYGNYSRDMDIYALDNDIPTFIREPAGDATVKEGESIDFKIRLSAKPAERMTVIHNIPNAPSSLHRSEERSDGITSFHFTPDNWNVAQTVSYFAFWKADGTDDDDVRRLTTRMLTGISGRLDTYAYNQLTIAGNGNPLVISTDELDVNEGASASFTVKLRIKPFDDSELTDTQRRITIALSKRGSGDVTISPTSLTFTPSNWDTAQTVTASAANDNDTASDTANISFSATGPVFGQATVTDGVKISVVERKLVLSVSELEIDEGADKNFNVKLFSQPSGNVTVSLETSHHQLSVSPTSLTFTPSTWDTNQSVTASVAEDDDAFVGRALRIDFSASGSNYNGITDTIEVEIAENDSLGLTLNASKMSMPEGGSDSFTVRLAAKPTGGNVSVESSSTNTDVSLSPASLTFDATNWKTPQTVTASAAEDDDAADDSASVTLTASGADYGGITASLPVDVEENDAVGLRTDPSTTLGLRLTEGNSSNFTVRLTARPTGGDVSVALAKSGSDDVSLSSTRLTFDATNWKTPQTITASAAEDDDGTDDSASIVLTASGADYGGITDTLQATVSDDDSPGLTLSAADLDIAEGGNKDFTVRPATQPSGNVSIALTASGSGDVSLSPTSLTFTPSNWRTARTVTVNAAEDADAVDDAASISVVASGADYGGISQSVGVDVTDNESRALIIDPESTLGLTEGSSKDLTVKLSAQPTGDVSVALSASGSDDMSLSLTSLTFKSDNWNTPRIVTVSAAEDDDGVDDTANLSLSASGADFGGIAGSIKIDITDNDSPGLTLSPSKLEIAEGGNKDFTVRLAIQPTGEVRIAIATSGSDDTSVSPTSLTFTRSNWDSDRNVTVSVAEDDDAVDDTASVSLTASGADYGGITDSLQVSVSENDSRGLTIDPPSTLGLTEGDNGTFTVRLTAQPSAGDVSVDLATSGSPDVSLSPTSLTFTVDNWIAPQTVTATAADDDDLEEDIASISLTASGADYGGITGSLQATVTDSGSPGLTLSSATLTIDEGSEESFTVKLAAQPSGEVILDLAASGSPDMSLDADPIAIGDQSRLIFTSSNWDSARTVMVSAAEDNDGVADSASISLTASGADYGGVSNSVQISITDNDTPGLSLSLADLGVTEGGEGRFSVRLIAQPTGGDVTVDLTKSGSEDVSLSASSLTFTRSDWSTEQTVTVSVAEDTDGIAESASVSLSASGADFDGVTGSIRISVTDNDTPGLVLSSLTLPVPEGGSNTIDVSLAIQPNGEVSVALTVSGSEDISLSTESLTFTDSDWSGAQSVTVSAAEDDDLAIDIASISLSASGAEYEGITDSVRVEVTENESRELIVSPSALGLTEGSDGTFTVILSSQPSWNVSVAMTASGSDDITLSPANLAFGPNDWRAPQTVTVSAAEDDDLDTDTATVSLAASGADYTDITGSLQVSVTDNDAPGLTISPTGMTMNEGSQREFTVKLAAQPSIDITVALASSNPDASLSLESLTFTNSNWNTERTVMVSAAEDDDFDADSATVSLTAAGAEYEGIAGNLSVQIVDNDISRLTISPTILTLVEGSDNTFTVRLNSRPSDQDTNLDLTVDNPDLTLSPERLTFTISNWQRDQTVTVSAAKDDDEDTDTATVSLVGTFDGDAISGSVQVTVTEGDAEPLPPPSIAQPLIFPSATSLSLDEGSSATFTVVGSAQPPEDVVITLSGGGSPDVSFDTDPRTDGNQNTLTFTPLDWNIERTIAVDAAEDSDAVADRANALFLGTVDNVTITGNLPIEVADNDTPRIDALPAALTIDESSSAIFSVRLDTRPIGNVRLTFDNGGSDTVISPSNLIVTPSNWRRARNVTVSGMADVDNTDDGPANISISAAGGGYDGIGAQVQVRVDEAAGPAAVPRTNAPGFVVAGTPVGVDEGGTSHFHLKLRNRPTASVEVTLSLSGTDVRVDTDTWRDGNQNTMVFSPSNFDGTRVVSVSALEDDDTLDELESLSFSATGGNYDGLEAAVSVSVDDNDSPALISSNPMSSTIDGTHARFTVNLSNPPSAPVGVTLSLPSSVEGVALDTDTDTPGNQTRLSFTPSNYATPQSVFITVVDDFQEHSIDITLRAGGGNYDGIQDIVTILMADIEARSGRGGENEYSDQGDPRYWWPVQTLAPAIPPPTVGDQAVINIGCRQDSPCEVFFECSTQIDGIAFRGGLPEPIAAWGIARLSAQEIAAITGADWDGMGRLGCALHSEGRISAQVWTRSGDGVLVNNSASLRSIDIEGVHRADIESIPGPDETDLSNIRIRCRAPHTKNCTATTLACFDDEGIEHGGDLGTIKRLSTRHLQTSELADIIGHRWQGSTLSCELRSDEAFTVQILTRTGGGGALVNNSASSSPAY